MISLIASRLRVGTLTAIVLFSQYSLAGSSQFIQQFASQSFVIPQLLIQQNKTKIGDLNIVQLKDEMKQVRWVENGGVFFAGSGETRTGAVYFVEEKKVIVNTLRAPYEPLRTMPVAALHEALGALGYIDENYEISMVLAMNALTSEEQELIFSKKFVDKQSSRLVGLKRRTTDAKYKSSGGGTSVGGGGDGVAVQAKMYALMFAGPICENFKIPCVDIREKLMALSIEVSMEPLEMRPYFEKSGDRKILRIPMIRWINGNMQNRSSSLMTSDQMIMLAEMIELIVQEVP